MSYELLGFTASETVGLWPFSEGTKPKLPSEIDVSALKGPGERALTHDEQRYSRAFAAFNDLVKKFREINPSFAHLTQAAEAYRDKLKADYVEFVQYTPPKGATGLVLVADAMEKLYAAAHKVFTEEKNRIIDIKDESKRKVWTDLHKDFFGDIKAAVDKVAKPLGELPQKVPEFLDQIKKYLPWIIGGAVVVIVLTTIGPVVLPLIAARVARR